MSYWCGMEIDAGGPEKAVVCESINMTSNLAGMWDTAGARLRDWNGMTGEESIPLLRGAIKAMEDDAPKYRAMNPSNGLGSYTSCLDYLRRLLEMATSAPKATWWVNH